MTTEMVQEYKKYYQDQMEYNKSLIKLCGGLEKIKDAYVVASDMVDICELALCQLYQNETRKKEYENI